MGCGRVMNQTAAAIAARMVAATAILISLGRAMMGSYQKALQGRMRG
jgi:hypothetical protein